MYTWNFTFKDNEGDEYQSNGHESLVNVREEWDSIRADNDNDCKIVDARVYDGNEFVSRFDMRGPTHPPLSRFPQW